MSDITYAHPRCFYCQGWENEAKTEANRHPDAEAAQVGDDYHWARYHKDPTQAPTHGGAPNERETEMTEAEIDGSTSDGYHTFDELYEYRMLYNAHAVHGWLAAGIPVVKSLRHSDGELCYEGGWFIVTAQLPTGQVSNHYPFDDWELFDVPEVETAPEWDGHTPADAANRLRDALLRRNDGLTR